MKRQNLRTVSLIVVTFTYLLFGAAIFGYLESEHELRQREYLELIELIVKRKYNISDDDFAVLTTTVIKSVPHKAGIQWKFPGAFYFATTVVTTIGYGHSTPATMAGRSFCMIYALIGIPLGLVMFQSIGERLNTFVGSALKWAKRCFKARNPEVTQTNLVMVVSVLSTILMTSMAAVFAKYERWDYFDALYYCFITLTTIGFGDYVALQKESALQAKPEYVALSLIFILFGLSVVSSAVNLLVLKFLTLNTQDERRDEQLRYTATLNPIQLEGDVITSAAGKLEYARDKSAVTLGRSSEGGRRQLVDDCGRHPDDENDHDHADDCGRQVAVFGRQTQGALLRARARSPNEQVASSEDDDDDDDDDELSDVWSGHSQDCDLIHCDKHLNFDGEDSEDEELADEDEEDEENEDEETSQAAIHAHCCTNQRRPKRPSDQKKPPVQTSYLSKPSRITPTSCQQPAIPIGGCQMVAIYQPDDTQRPPALGRPQPVGQQVSVAPREPLQQIPLIAPAVAYPSPMQLGGGQLLVPINQPHLARNGQRLPGGRCDNQQPHCPSIQRGGRRADWQPVPSSPHLGPSESRGPRRVESSCSCSWLSLSSSATQPLPAAGANSCLVLNAQSLQLGARSGQALDLRPQQPLKFKFELPHPDRRVYIPPGDRIPPRGVSTRSNNHTREELASSSSSLSARHRSGRPGRVRRSGSVRRAEPKRSESLARQAAGQRSSFSSSSSPRPVGGKSQVPKLVCKCCCQHEECIRHALETARGQEKADALQNCEPIKTPDATGEQQNEAETTSELISGDEPHLVSSPSFSCATEDPERQPTR